MPKCELSREFRVQDAHGRTTRPGRPERQSVRVTEPHVVLAELAGGRADKRVIRGCRDGESFYTTFGNTSR